MNLSNRCGQPRAVGGIIQPCRQKLDVDEQGNRWCPIHGLLGIPLPLEVQ